MKNFKRDLFKLVALNIFIIEEVAQEKLRLSQ
jgi:hypothetical protein